MLIAGAGGHALEVLDILLSSGVADGLWMYDQNRDIRLFQGQYPVIHHEGDLAKVLSENPQFVFGTGSPTSRRAIYTLMTKLGGQLHTLRGQGSQISPFADCAQADIMGHCFVGPNTRLGLGVLVNTGAQIHHEAQVGDFAEIGPAAVLLGSVRVGEHCSIGANATILPGIKIGNQVTIGAGAVVTRDLPDRVTAVGVPARIVNKNLGENTAG